MPRLGARRTEANTQRMARIVELRRKRVSVIDIAAELGISHQRVSQIYAQALAEIPARAVHLHRAEDLALIDDAICDMLKIATEHGRSPRTSVEAWNAIRGYLERKARMLGMDAPAKIEVSDATDQAIRALAAELAGGLGELEPGGEAAAAGDAAPSEAGTHTA